MKKTPGIIGSQKLKPRIRSVAAAAVAKGIPRPASIVVHATSNVPRPPGRNVTLPTTYASTNAAVIKTTGATVVKTHPGVRRNIHKKDPVIVQYYMVGKAKKRPAAVEIVVLPAGSKFR